MKASLSEWKEFMESAVYADMQEELTERYNIILPKLIAGKDTAWSDDCMRGRLDELEFAASIAQDIRSALAIKEGKKTNFISSLYNNFINKQNKERDDGCNKPKG